MEDFSTDVLTVQDLVYGGVVDLVQENRISARRWARLVALHERAPDPGETALPGWGPMQPREWTVGEVGSIWAFGDQHLRSEVNTALFIAEHLPEVWEMCIAGELDHYRASVVADLMRHRIDEPAAWAVVAERITTFLRKHLRSYPACGPDLNIQMVTCTVVQLRNRMNYEIRRILTDDEEFQRQYADRKVRVIAGDDGIAQLSVTGATDQVLLARHRLHLSAKALRAAGDERTVEQLMADLALDLIIGKADGVAVPAFARPIINVTVPLETLAGLSDDPGRLSGGSVIPADLARAIATSEGATWFRLLTDPSGEPVALSTKSYQPTSTIWRHVVATRPTCAHPTCDRPSAECELDHVIAWPAGPTAVENLEPLCRRHHKAKHVSGERPDLEWEYWNAS